MIKQRQKCSMVKKHEAVVSVNSGHHSVNTKTKSFFLSAPFALRRQLAPHLMTAVLGANCSHV